MQTWMYIMVPLVLYAVERFLRMYRTNSIKVDVVKVRTRLLFLTNGC
jgi:hypothetical protein